MYETASNYQLQTAHRMAVGSVPQGRDSAPKGAVPLRPRVDGMRRGWRGISLHPAGTPK
jgi:hypothetical protein